MLFEEIVHEVDALQKIVGVPAIPDAEVEALDPPPRYWPFKSTATKKPKKTNEKYWPFKKMSVKQIEENEDRAFTH